MLDADPLDADAFNHIGRVTAPTRAAELRRQATAAAGLYRDLVARQLLDSRQTEQDANAVLRAWQEATGVYPTEPAAFRDDQEVN